MSFYFKESALFSFHQNHRHKVQQYCIIFLNIRNIAQGLAIFRTSTTNQIKVHFELGLLGPIQYIQHGEANFSPPDIIHLCHILYRAGNLSLINIILILVTPY